MDTRYGHIIARLGEKYLDEAEGEVLRTPPPGVSITIPCWNAEFFLGRSIKSALSAVSKLQSAGVDAEVLVIDDGSRDGSLTLLRQLEAIYYPHGLRVLALAHNQGLPRVRNLALRVARYRHMIYLDADNQLAFENTPLFYRAAIETKAAIVYGNLLAKAHETQEVVFMGSNQSFQPKMFHTNYIDACALYDRAQIFDAGTYQTHPEIYGHEDWELFLHLAANGRLLVFVPVTFGTYYINPGSMLEEIRGNAHYNFVERYIQRVYDQLEIRQSHAINTQHVRYHPDIGYL